MKKEKLWQLKNGRGCFVEVMNFFACSSDYRV